MVSIHQVSRWGVHPTFEMWVAYLCIQPLLHILLPFVFLLFAYRSLREPDYLRGWTSRLGFGPTGPKGSVWIYAASLGETRAASPLIHRLLARNQTILLTHMSAAGLREGNRLFGSDPRVTVRYVPLDLFWALQIFLRRSRPKIGIVLEIEIWPAMLMEASRQGIPMILANGNLLEESLSRMSGIRRRLFSLYRLFSMIFTRNEAYRQRYIRIGVEPDRVRVVGELRYDLEIPRQQIELGQNIRSRWARERPVFMIASSVKDEEPALIELVTELTNRVEGLRVVWAPRSPQRFDAVAAALTTAGLRTVRRSSLGPAMQADVPAATQLLLGDSMGEMFTYYTIADLVFVGASLCNDGGHNIVEPLSAGRPVVMGPSIYGVAFVAEEAAKAGVFRSLSDVTALVDYCHELLGDASRLSEMGQSAAKFASSYIGSADRTIIGLTEFLAQAEQPAKDARSSEPAA